MASSISASASSALRSGAFLLPRSSPQISGGGVTRLSFRGGYSAKRLQISCKTAKPDTVEKVIEIVTKQLCSEKGVVQPHSKFGDLGADSLDQVEIVMALEEAFGISVDESGAEAIATVQDAADLIERTLCDKEDKAPAA